MSSRFSIPNPCHKKWTDLRGEGRERFCEECRTPVYARELYSDEEWDRIWRDSSGYVCAVLSDESVRAPRTRRAVLAGALLTAISPLMAQTGRLRVRVLDPGDAVIPGAEVVVMAPDGKIIQKVRSDGVGEAVFTGLPGGECRIVISDIGFKSLALTRVIQNAAELKIDARLAVGQMTMGTIVTAGSVFGSARIRVTDPTGARIKGFQAVVLGWDGKPTRTFVAGDAGEVEIKELPLGPVQIDVRTTGFKTQRLTLMIRAGEDVMAETSLEVGTVGTFIQVGPPPIGNARIRVTDREGRAIELFQASVRELDSQPTTVLTLTLKNEREVKADVVLEPGTSDKVIQAKPQ